MKLKLEIQRFNSTNQTTHYELSQYTANDKPTYLIDYNGDMSKIDTAIYGADARSTVNATSIGDLTTLDTTAKSDLVSAVNEIKSATDTNTSNISTNTSNISTLGSNQGTMANLTTTDKTSLVGAINEVNAVNQTQGTQIAENTSNIEKFNLIHFDTFDNTNIQHTSNISSITGNITVASNDDGSIFKIYSSSFITSSSDFNSASVYFDTRLRPESNITINGAGIRIYQDSNYSYIWFDSCDLNISTTGRVTLNVTKSFPSEARQVIVFTPCLYFGKNFGDTPTPTPNN